MALWMSLLIRGFVFHKGVEQPKLKTLNHKVKRKSKLNVDTRRILLDRHNEKKQALKG